MKRREFLNRIAFGTLITGGALVTSAVVKIPVPQTGYAARRYSIGNINQYPLNYFTFLPEKNIFIYRDRKGIKAVSAICTHLGCILQRSDTGFRCPCHGSKFNNRGEAVSGPAIRDLDWHSVIREPDGRIMIVEDISVSPETLLEI